MILFSCTPGKASISPIHVFWHTFYLVPSFVIKPTLLHDTSSICFYFIWSDHLHSAIIQLYFFKKISVIYLFFFFNLLTHNPYFLSLLYSKQQSFFIISKWIHISSAHDGLAYWKCLPTLLIQCQRGTLYLLHMQYYLLMPK